MKILACAELIGTALQLGIASTAETTLGAIDTLGIIVSVTMALLATYKIAS